MNRKIYIVIGETGEYSDREEWVVKAFTSEKRAEAFILMLHNWLMEKGVFYATNDVPVNYYKRKDLECPHDSQFQVDYTGTRYSLRETELEEVIDEKD